MTRVVIAPDSFKGTASASEIAAALARGWLAVRPGDEVLEHPMADGGEGTAQAIEASRVGAQRIPVTVTGPDDRPVATHWLRLPEADGTVTALVELAATSGITLLDELRPLTAHTRGFGQAIAAALDAGADRLLLAIGGSASTDLGIGMLRALGARALDEQGREVPEGNAGMAELHRLDVDALRPLPRHGAIVLTDVRTPLTGPTGAVATFGPQKGITPDLAAQAEAAVVHAARVLGGDPGIPGSGAAGGTGFGLRFWGATLRSGARAVADEIGLAAVLSPDTVVITGEGRFDGQSEQGKVPSHVRELARAAGAEVLLVAGAIEADASGFDGSVSLSELAGSRRAAIAQPLVWAERAGGELARAVRA
jgi:glycerate kinase